MQFSVFHSPVNRCIRKGRLHGSYSVRVNEIRLAAISAVDDISSDIEISEIPFYLLAAMETVIMAARVTLLILVTGAFAAMWSGDHPQAIKPAKPVQTKWDFRQDVLPNRRQETPTDIHPQTRRIIREGAMLALGTPTKAPLPVGIVAGTYLVADQFGRTEIRVIHPQEVPHRVKIDHAPAASQHYMVEVHSARWHFIRIEASRDPQTATIPRIESHH